MPDRIQRTVSVCVLGPDGSGKSSVVAGIRDRMDDLIEPVVIRHLKPHLFFRKRRQRIGPVTDPHGQAPRSTTTSVFKVLSWVTELWLDKATRRHSAPRLTIWDRYFHDLLVDPARYRYGGPRWLPKLLTHCVPTPDVFMILDAPAEVLQARKQEVEIEETARQRAAYRDLANALPSAVILDASRDVDSVISNATAITVACFDQGVAENSGRK